MLHYEPRETELGPGDRYPVGFLAQAKVLNRRTCSLSTNIGT